jgi:hypothetical protein
VMAAGNEAGNDFLRISTALPLRQSFSGRSRAFVSVADGAEVDVRTRRSGR